MKQDMNNRMMKSAVHKHERNMHPGKPVTKLRKGGPTGEMMRTMGRNKARAQNQGSK
jgi:hypothetical protein